MKSVRIGILTLSFFLFLSPGVPDRYHLRPDLGGHPSALQQQQHQHANSDPQQVHSLEIYWKQIQQWMYWRLQHVRFNCFWIRDTAFFLSTAAIIVFQHFHISFKKNIRLSCNPVISGTDWSMCFVFPTHFVFLTSCCEAELPLLFQRNLKEKNSD